LHEKSAYNASLGNLCVSVPLWLIIAEKKQPQRHRDTEKRMYVEKLEL
jgi:hypothetical protein